MPNYFAISNRNGRWEYISSGPDPEELLHDAQEIILEGELYPEEEEVGLSPDTDALETNLRIVPAESARELYHLTFPKSTEDL
jgi:hypothetical protein